MSDDDKTPPLSRGQTKLAPTHPLSRFKIPPDVLAQYQALGARPPTLEDLINQLISLDVLIEAKKGHVDDVIVAGMEIVHDRTLLQIASMVPLTEPSGLFKYSVLAYRPRTTLYGHLPGFLAEQQQRFEDNRRESKPIAPTVVGKEMPVPHDAKKGRGSPEDETSDDARHTPLSE